jgi:hypothetical protein
VSCHMQSTRTRPWHRPGTQPHIANCHRDPSPAVWPALMATAALSFRIRDRLLRMKNSRNGEPDRAPPVPTELVSELLSSSTYRRGIFPFPEPPQLTPLKERPKSITLCCVRMPRLAQEHPRGFSEALRQCVSDQLLPNGAVVLHWKSPSMRMVCCFVSADAQAWRR